MIQNIAIGAQPIQKLEMISSTTQNERTFTGAEQSFGSYLRDALEEVAAQEQHSKEMGNKLVLGEVNVDEAMVASQQALLSLQLTTQIRNRAIEAYQEIMRTQI